MSEPKPPAGLSEPALRWWNKSMEEYEAWTADALLTLEAALQAYDRWQQAKGEIDRDGLTGTDRFGQPRLHPACAVERDSRGAMLRALAALGLEPPAEVGKPDASALGRKAALTRWHRGQ
jgi:P27 family predicted phage terminase small subunit